MEARVVARIEREGPLPFDDVVDQALYGPGGFYTTGGGAGRDGADFLTSPEVGTLFGACVARALDEEWWALGEPPAFVVIEGGAGAGVLCRSVLDASPACGLALRYLMVERSPALRARAEAALQAPVEVVPASAALARSVVPHQSGPVVAVLDDLPPGPIIGVVFANELLDNLAPSLVRRTVQGGWEELRVGLDRAEQLSFVGAPASAALVATAERLAGGAPLGAVVPVQRHAQRWLQRARSLMEAGRVVCVDYADSTASLARRPVQEWLRTYAGHARRGHPLERLGEQDITCEVAVDQLTPDMDTAQADWLRAKGLEELVEHAPASSRAAVAPDLQRLVARSRIQEAAALTDPAGLGAFRVLEWTMR